MPQVRISVSDLKCVRQADSMGKDDVYWIANLQCAAAVDPRYTDMTKLAYDAGYRTSLPEMVPIGAGETKRFSNSVVFDGEVRAGWYLFGTVHFMERDTPMSNYVAKIWAVLGMVFGGLAIAAVIGFAIGWWLGGWSIALGAAIIAIAAVGVVGFLVGALIVLSRPAETDAHLGGLRVQIGPLAAPPPGNDKETWPLTVIPSGRLDVVDEHGAELISYVSSHDVHPVASGHRYETALQLEVSGGHR
jgi:hypothetical protein